MKNIYKIDLALIFVSLFILIGVVGYVNPSVIAPINNYETTDTEILFSIEKADYLFIDDNFDFTSPEKYNLKDGLKINLKPGKYYWKAVGVLESEVRILTINSEVNLILELGDDGYSVVNAGNVNLNVDVYNGTELVDSVRVGISDRAYVDGNKFVGSQKDE